MMATATRSDAEARFAVQRDPVEEFEGQRQCHRNLEDEEGENNL